MVCHTLLKYGDMKVDTSLYFIQPDKQMVECYMWTCELQEYAVCFLRLGVYLLSLHFLY